MGPRGSALICGYTTYHKMVEESLAELKKKEVLLCSKFKQPHVPGIQNKIKNLQPY